MTALLSGLSSPPSGWSETTPYCQWTGVKCDASNRVTSLNLNYTLHQGTLPGELNKLSQLKLLHLRHSSFSGAFPSLSGLASLQEAYLDGNRFDSAPSGFLEGLTSLQALNLTDNPNLPPWSLPTYLTQSRSLVSLYASNASLTGCLPDIFSSFPNLRDLDLSCNNLTGPIPQTLAALTNLESLDVSHNNLTGTIPAFSPKMKTLNLAYNPLLVSPVNPVDVVLIHCAVGLAFAIVLIGLSYMLYVNHKQHKQNCKDEKKYWEDNSYL